MSYKVNIIILAVVGLLAAAGLVFGYYYYTKGIEQEVLGMVSNTMGLPHQQRWVRLESENIRLFYPEPPFQFKAGEPVEVIGEARVKSGKVTAEMTYNNGEVIDKEEAAVKARPESDFGSFSLTFNLPSREVIGRRQIDIKIYDSSLKNVDQKDEVFFPVVIID